MAVMSITFVFALFSLLVSYASSMGLTDTITWGGDNSRTGYQTNHNMDPAIVGSPQFGQIFKTALPGHYNGVLEQIFSQPLVYTLADGVQYIFVATTQNNVYKLNAKTGAIVAQRNLHIPFLAVDLAGCVDINPHVGVTATGVIDNTTDTYYLLAKTYQNQTGGNRAQGLLNGRYYIHAIDCNDLSERPNFPVPLQSTVATNNAARIFGGGIHHARPGLLHSGEFIYGGFASHCVHDNFTGWVIGWDKTSGNLVEHFATEGLGVDDQTKGGGVWMSGGGISSDDAGSMFFATGNGYASQLSTIPVKGHNPPTALEEAAVHMSINNDGSLTLVDFFMPWEKTQLDGADRDLGTSPLELLPKEFACGSIARMGVVTGKSGKTYFLNLDDLGGYQNGPDKLDNVIQVYQNENSVYAGAGVYPGEGGYIYINVINYASHVFKFICSNGVPSFTKIADTPETDAYSGLGVSHGTVTTLNGVEGSGLFWITDTNGYNLRIYNAVPAKGFLTLVNHFNIPGVTKFTRPVFGDGRLYVGTTQGFLYGFGAPVNLPLNCSSPYDFAIADLGTTTNSKTVTCTALIALSISNITLTGTNFVISDLPAVPLSLAVGASFTFRAAFGPTAVGKLSSDVIVSSVNGVTGYSSTIPISLQGSGQSVKPLLDVSPVTLSFPGVITGQQPGGTNQTVLFKNSGNNPLTISNIFYSTTSETGPFTTPNTTDGGLPQVGPFIFYDFPNTIAPNDLASVTINFDTSVSGNFAAYVNVTSNGGSKVFDVVGTSGDAPVALVEFQTPDGLSWVTYVPGKNFTFGNVTENTTRSLKVRITNNATIDSARLSLTISKAPFGTDGIINANNQVDLAEGTTLGPGENATAVLYCSVPKTQWDTVSYVGDAHWTMNFNDLAFVKADVGFVCTAVAEQAPPLLPNGYGQYRYVGCFKENNPGRQLKTQLYGNDKNTNAMCIAACAAGDYIFCGTQYNRECWAGPTIPNLQVDETMCDYPCSGDVNQICGGNGVGALQGGAYISLFVDSLQYGGNSTSPSSSTGGPVVNPGINGWSSIGCYAEPATGRALPNEVSTTSKTVDLCLTACAAYSYAGLEYGGECWCGNAINLASLPTNITDCSMTCKDNSTEYCGAGQRLNVYRFNSSLVSSASSTVSPTSTSSNVSATSATSASATPTSPVIKPIVSTSWSFVGCYTESTTGRALASTTYANDSMTLESCGTFCTGYKMFGVEYGRECYCGNVLTAGSVAATVQSDCSFPCPGDVTEYCGAGVRLELYTAIASSATSVLSTSSLQATSSSLSSTSLEATSTALSSSSDLPTSTSLSSTSTTSAAATYTGPPVISSGKTNFTYYGCVSEPSSGRLFASQVENNSTTMTIERCLTDCWMYAYAGVEYGRECWCGNTLNLAGNAGATPGAVINDSQCSFTCPGNSSEYCGAGLRMSLFWNATTGTGPVVVG